MADYRLTATDVVERVADHAFIPNDPMNRDRVEYDKWTAEGGVADPYVPPTPSEQTPTPQQQVIYDHENRLRSIEGQPPLELDAFMKKMVASVPTPK